MSFDSYDFNKKTVTDTSEVALPDNISDTEYDKITSRRSKLTNILTTITLSALALNLLLIFAFIFYVNPVFKLRCQMLFTDNCKITIATHSYFSSSNIYQYNSDLHTISEIYMDGNAYAIAEKSDYHPNMYDYYVVEDGKTYHCVYTGTRWEAIEVKNESNSEAGLEENIMEIILDPSNFKKEFGKPRVWHLKRDVSEEFSDLRVKYKNGMFMFYWTEGFATVYIIFDSFGDSHIDPPWLE